MIYEFHLQIGWKNFQAIWLNFTAYELMINGELFSSGLRDSLSMYK